MHKNIILLLCIIFCKAFIYFQIYRYYYVHTYISDAIFGLQMHNKFHYVFTLHTHFYEMNLYICMYAHLKFYVYMYVRVVKK